MLRRRGASFATFGVAVGILLAGTGALGPSSGGPERTLAAPDLAAPVVDAAPAGIATSSAVVASAPAPVAAPVEVLPEPLAAPSAGYFQSMRHVWQSLNNCGPAAVVMALSALGVSTDQETARLALRGSDVRRGMSPAPVGPWVAANWGLRSIWRNDGSVDLLKRLVANGFAPMVTQWMQDVSVSRIAHWRTVRGYDDAAGAFYVNDSMLGNGVALKYDWFARNWQSFSYRYMVIYKPEDELLLKAIVGPDWSDSMMRRNLYQRAKSEALSQGTSLSWLAYGEASYGYGMFDEAVVAFEKGLSMGPATGVFGVRSSYPQALRALGRQKDSEKALAFLNSTSAVPSTVVAAPDSYAVWLATKRLLPFDQLPLE